MSTDNTQLFIKYKETGSVAIRNEIVMRYMGIAKYVALSMRNIYSKYADTDDIVNEGVIALISAVETFDVERGVKFETYANLKVKGAIIDYVRKQDWVPRQLRKFSKDIDAAFNELYTKLGRQPDNQELADFMGVDKERLIKNMADMAGAVTLSFEELLYEDNFDAELSGKTGKFSDADLYEKELTGQIATAIEGLNPKEKQVVTLYYYEKLKFSEIAKVLGVTESRVCQIHSKSMLLLKRQLSGYVKG